jgi:hypothetical protein
MADYEAELDPNVELLMRRAGVPADSKLGHMFAGSYAGDWNEEAIQDAYQDVASEVSRGDRSELASEIRQRQSLVQGAVGDTGTRTPASSRRQIVNDELDALKAGKSREDAMADGFNRLIGHAVETGDGVLE